MPPHSDQLQMEESLSVTFEQGPLPPPAILSEAGLNLKLWGSRVEPHVSLHNVALCLVSP